MADSLAGTAALVRLGLRRDRVLLPVWLVGFAAMAGYSAKAAVGLYPDEASRVAAARAINATTALVALYGRIYDPTSLGALSMIKLTAFGAAALAVLVVFVTVRHTRAEEETGRLELLCGGRLGRPAPLAAALAIGMGASAALGVLTAVALAAAGLPVGGSLAFGLGWAATGTVFAAVAAVTAQVTASARTASGLGLVVVAVTYGLRAVGDLAEHGPSLLSWLSPIGWNQQVRAYAGDHWLVLLLPLALSAALVPVAFALRARRDLGAGLLAVRPGPADGRLHTVAALAVRLHRGGFAAWAVAFAAFGVLLGSLASNVSGILTSAAAQDLITRLGGRQGLTDAYLAAMLGILGIVAAGYGVATATRLRAEEAAGHTEALLATATTRTRWASSHYGVALAGVAALLGVAGLAVGAGHALAVHDAGQVGRVVLAALALVPAAWVMASAVLAVFGWAPRLVPTVWAVYAVFVVLGEFGVLWRTPQWVMDLSPFQHSPRLPVAGGGLTPVGVLILVAAALAAVGYAGWRRRDLQP